MDTLPIYISIYLYCSLVCTMRWQRVYADAQPLSGNGREYIRLRIHWESTAYSVPHPGPRSTCVLWYWRLVKPSPH